MTIKDLIQAIQTDFKNAGFRHVEKDNTMDYALLQSAVGSILRFKDDKEGYLTYTTHGKIVREIVVKYI